MDLISAAQNFSKLKKFIERDLHSLFVKIHLDAAASALSGLDYAKNKYKVCWSAINHLEVVEQTLKAQLRGVSRFEATKKYLYVSALKSLIYKYINEDNLVNKCCDDSLYVVKQHNEYTESRQLFDIVGFWNSIAWGKLIRFHNSDFGKKARSFNATNFWKENLDRNEFFGLLYMGNDYTSYI